MMRTYSFITEFKGNIYLSCYQSCCSSDAFRNWLDGFISQSYVSKMQQKQIMKDALNKDLAPVPLKNLEGIWCWWINPWGKSLLLNFMETLEWEENSVHTYTFIALYDGGTYISQHKGIDLDDSVKLWLYDFIRTPYLKDSQKEILLSCFVISTPSFIKESCNFRVLHLPLCDKQLDLYIAKTRTD